MLSLNPLFEREWRERFRRRASYFQLGGLVLALCAVLCFGIWHAGSQTALTALAWRANGRAMLDFYRVAAGVLFWSGALLLGSVGVSDEKSGATWEHLLLCPLGGRGLCAGKIASGAAFLGVLQAVLLPVLLVAGQCFGVSASEIAGVMMSHLLLTVQGATLGFWGALRGQTLIEGLAQSLAAIGRLVMQTVIFVVGASWFVVLLGGAFTAVTMLAPSSVAVVFKWLMVAFVGALFWAAKGLVSFVAGMTGVGVLAQSAAQLRFALWPPLLWAGQLAGVALFLKWSAWEVDYPAREFGEVSVKPNPTRSNVPVRPLVSRPVVLPSSRPVQPRVPLPFEARNPRKSSAPPLFGTNPPPAAIPRPAPLPVRIETQAQPVPISPRHAEEMRPFTLSPTRWKVLYRVWSWTLSPAQLAAFPIKETRDSGAKSLAMLPTWEQTFAPKPVSQVQAKDASLKTVRRMRAPVSRRFQEWNPVLWLDLTRCLSLRSPDSKMVPILLSVGALGGSFVFAVGLFLLVGWVQNALGGARGDVSSLRSSWDNLHWALRWGALGFGPLWGATGYVVERRTGMLVELRLTMLSARAVWWGKFLSRFGIVAALSLPLLALVAFFACNWPDKNGAMETLSALVSSWALASWSLLACLWVSDSCRRELGAALWCGALGVVWGVLLWNFPTMPWTPIHLFGAVLAGGHLFLRLKRLGFG